LQNLLPKFDHALIDADILVYRIGFTTQGAAEGIARYRLDEFANNIINKVAATKATFFITSDDKSNFRFGLYPDYKANRKNKPKPEHYDFLRKRLQDEFFATVVSGEEADDALAKMLLEPSDEARVLCSIDKDLDQIPGWHYNFVTERYYNISEIEGWRSFYAQCLVGDPTDNIPGCPRIGTVKSNQMLEGCQSESEMLGVVLKAYQKAYSNPGEAVERLWLNGNLLWIRRKGEDMWASPTSLGDEVNSKTRLKRLLSLRDEDTSTSPELSST
jgi:5'-3' exonuclease